MASYKQSSFKGGMDTISNDTDIAPDAYRYLFNSRQRYNNIQSIQKSIDITYNLTGKFQGLYAVGSIWLTFFSGRAFYMPIGGNTWFQVPFLSLDAFVDYIYVAPVTGSINNFLRQAVVTSKIDPVSGNSSIVIDARAGVIQTPFFVSGTPAGLVCQDGLNQPWLITYDAVNNNATARVLGNYTQWDNTGATSNNQEYVPIGTRMMFDGVRLYIVNGNLVFRSVSGAPLNFVVSVDTNGNKLPTEALGGAVSTSFAFDFDPITAIFPSTTAAGVFILATSRNIYGVQPDLTNTIFAEPTFIKAFQLASGIVNQFSNADNLGDTVFTDFEAVKSFNAVAYVKFAGRNDPFSKNLSSLLTGIQQTFTCCFSFDNYIRFSLKTIFGNVIAIYDSLNKVWVGLDITKPSAAGIKMFAQADFLDVAYLGAGTLDNKIYLMEADKTDVEYGTAQLRAFVPGTFGISGNFIPDMLDAEHKLNYARVAVSNEAEGGTMTVHAKIDEEKGQFDTKNIEGKTAPIVFPIMWPITFDGAPRVQNLTFSLDQGAQGYKIIPTIMWKSNCKIEEFDIDTTTYKSPVSNKQQEKALDGTLSSS